MAQELDVNKENVRMLVLTHGPRPAARMCGLNENTVLQWTSRYGWLDHLKEEINKPQLPASMQKQQVIGVINPADALQKALADDSQATRVAGLRYSKLVTQHAVALAEISPDEALTQAPLVKAALQGAALAGNWAGQSGEQVAVLSFFLAAAPRQGEGPVVDIEPAE